MDEKPVVYVTRRIPEPGIELLEERCKIVMWEEEVPPSKGHIMKKLTETEAFGLLCNVSDTIDADVLASSPNLKVVSTFSVGYDHIDVEEAAQQDIMVGYTPGVLSETTADLTWALMSACARRVVESHEYVLDGKWKAWGPTTLLGHDLHNRTLGIIGIGSIGSAVARRSIGFGMDVVYSHPYRKNEQERELAEMGVDIEYVPQDELLQTSDFVSLHVPLKEETYDMIGSQEFKKMNNEGILINTSRGEIVDMDALDNALEDESIAAAALDVTNPEPLPSDHSILRHEPEKLVVTPHIGSASTPTRERMSVMSAENILAALEGKSLPNSVFDQIKEVS
ncbi:2-hydroxyacid dehydrogenase [Halobellus captivus]|uniref:2-hydroxyacid dehydrogenase n=1 Tax=Halobellus captivus TaxID=2592614 RepID=UPI00119EE9A8|nr:D-glycerate dehydrogenase [Halobellus captivus]